MIALRGILLKNDETKKWQWRGVWTFGDLPDHVGNDLDSLKLKVPNVRPFQYTWESPKNAAEVQIPSLSTTTTTTAPMEEDDDEDEDNDTSMGDPPEAAKLTTEAVSVAKKENNEGIGKKTKLAGNDKELVAVKKDKTVAESNTSEDEKLKNDGRRESASKVRPLIRDRKGESAKKNPSSNDDKSSTASYDLAQDDDDKSKGKPEKPLGVTFATVSPDDPAYTPASTLHNAECPADGNWSGFFENIVRGRKAHNRVMEEFSLFLNATPSKEARAKFIQEGDIDSDKKAALLPEGRIHVRGTGRNQFGIFELIGSFDRDSSVLELQRMYVMTSDEPASDKPSTPRKLTTPSPRKSTSRSYSTRKRQLSWQRRSTLSDDEDEIVGMQRHNGSSQKKRPRTQSMSTASGMSAEKLVLTQNQSQASAMLPPPPVMMVPQNNPSVGAKRPPITVPSAALSPKRRGNNDSRSTNNNNNTLSSSSTPSNIIKLPSVGDPDEARWRAAHFLYYQRNDPQPDENGTSASSSGTPTTSFVVYEGEMLHGRSMREGRGLCLYNNGTLYEGEWKRNREHGIGTLMTADRRRIIYNGEWERGRMHGSGVYYFTESPLYPGASSSSTPTSSKKKFPALPKDQIPRYEGEFKENTRHGNGKYFLPDGSTYEGEWRENLMSGRGTFVWPDGSLYIGSWKDGKRHGQGLLRASDKFTYDGMWVDNAMEGRGIAEYPSGQTYEGLWANGRREGRGTIRFTNGAVYEGRFRDDSIEGQGTMKMSQTVKVKVNDGEDTKDDWMIPISFQSDMGHIHQRAGFTIGGE